MADGIDTGIDALKAPGRMLLGAPACQLAPMSVRLVTEAEARVASVIATAIVVFTAGALVGTSRTTPVA